VISELGASRGQAFRQRGVQWRRRWALPQGPCLLVDLEPGLLELLDDPLGELVAGIIRRVFSKGPAELSRLRDRAKPIENTADVAVACSSCIAIDERAA